MSHCPAYIDAIHDCELTGWPLGLYLRLYHDHLDAWQYRTVKQEQLRYVMRRKDGQPCSRSTVAEGLALLLRLGYLEMGPVTHAAEARTYRLVHSRMRAMTADG
jgi:hypothetical protein